MTLLLTPAAYSAAYSAAHSKYTGWLWDMIEEGGGRRETEGR